MTKNDIKLLATYIFLCMCVLFAGMVAIELIIQHTMATAHYCEHVESYGAICVPANSAY